ncbi:hypothetical protein [Burkholderia gladioli]|uniref:hypothetical protein n=1 Tax=Burkholderia gladioli TaxID=28095 RepID=UPI001640460A|nr:hypothetical protein [Burkholderia gladioli]
MIRIDGASEMTEEGKAGAEAAREYKALPNSELIERLRVGAADCGQNSMTARLTAVIDLVEALLARGYDRSQVRDWLIGAGFEFTPDSFDSAVGRIRKRRLGASGIVKQLTGPLFDAQASTPAHDVEVPMVTSSAASQTAPSGESEQPMFSDLFAERRDFTAGRRWK